MFYSPEMAFNPLENPKDRTLEMLKKKYEFVLPQIQSQEDWTPFKEALKIPPYQNDDVFFLVEEYVTIGYEIDGNQREDIHDVRITKVKAILATFEADMRALLDEDEKTFWQLVGKRYSNNVYNSDDTSYAIDKTTTNRFKIMSVEEFYRLKN